MLDCRRESIHISHISRDSQLLLKCDVTAPASAAGHTENTAWSTVACAYRGVSIEPSAGNALSYHNILYKSGGKDTRQHVYCETLCECILKSFYGSSTYLPLYLAVLF